MKFSQFDIKDALNIITLDVNVFRDPVYFAKSLKITSRLPFNDNGEIWPSDEDKAVMRLPLASWEAVAQGNSEVEAGEYWRWDEPFIYHADAGKPDPEVLELPPRTIVARFLCAWEVTVPGLGLSEGLVFQPIACKGDPKLSKEWQGKPLVRPGWYFRRAGADMNLKRLGGSIERSFANI